MENTEVFGVRINKALRANFIAQCEKKGLSPNACITQMISYYTKAKGKLKLDTSELVTSDNTETYSKKKTGNKKK